MVLSTHQQSLFEPGDFSSSRLVKLANNLFLDTILPGFNARVAGDHRWEEASSAALDLFGGDVDSLDFKTFDRKVKKYLNASGDMPSYALVHQFRKAHPELSKKHPLTPQLRGYIHSQSTDPDYNQEELGIDCQLANPGSDKGWDWDAPTELTKSRHESGRCLEDDIDALLSQHRVQFILRGQAPFFKLGSKQQARPDFTIASTGIDERLRHGWYIEAKNRQAERNGVDTDLVNLLVNIEMQYDKPVLIVYEGSENNNTYLILQDQFSRIQGRKARLERKLLGVYTLQQFRAFTVQALSCLGGAK